ncbi:Holliday junction ATP-dependent DNA helicase RuvB [Andreprevotia sp. IGB-42]|uniref:AAA family ATPase n=1 Tax=Andreprevotia sp. IGB-42 TaxID=2497473 RepID=UPI00135770DC|nr:AAA family ATPase [Andreprevotia sp. IGB-42]KAF0814231.1 Holliday junction ATP-dependent DNA helicase RuvB [Andreprevotia sp. IGB-42]
MAHPLTSTLQQLNQIILGKDTQLRLALACLLARGHLLLEDVPGVGKTTLAHALAVSLGLKFQRTQFTSDLLPADLLGVSIYERDTGLFRFHQGPVFTQVLLGDEINRAPPKTQSALLEAMEERQVTIDGATYPLPEPFFVIATQNPQHQIGTFPLPESQLDRFLMRIELGYPDANAERAMLVGSDRRDLIAQLGASIEADALLAAQNAVAALHISPALLDYVQALALATRNHADFAYGLSPRALLGLVNAARAWAWLDNRDYVIPEDIQAVFPSVAGHRLPTRASGRPDPRSAAELLSNVAIP